MANSGDKGAELKAEIAAFRAELEAMLVNKNDIIDTSAN